MYELGIASLKVMLLEEGEAEEAHKHVISKPSSLGVTFDGAISVGIWTRLNGLNNELRCPTDRECI